MLSRKKIRAGHGFICLQSQCLGGEHKRADGSRSALATYGVQGWPGGLETLSLSPLHPPKKGVRVVLVWERYLVTNIFRAAVDYWMWFEYVPTDP